MPDCSKTYSTLVVQPIDLINAFKLDFCFASVIKWLTKWQMEKKNEHLTRAKYYLPFCTNSKVTDEFEFALTMYCIANSFIKSPNEQCLLSDVVLLIALKKVHDAIYVIESRMN